MKPKTTKKPLYEIRRLPFDPSTPANRALTAMLTEPWNDSDSPEIGLDPGRQYRLTPEGIKRYKRRGEVPLGMQVCLLSTQAISDYHSAMSAEPETEDQFRTVSLRQACLESGGSCGIVVR